MNWLETLPAASAKSSWAVDSGLGWETRPLHRYFKWTYDQASILRAKAGERMPYAIEFGCATASFSMELARRGYNVSAFDIGNSSQIIFARNKVLKEENVLNGQIFFSQKDISALSLKDWCASCARQELYVVAGHNVIHFIDFSKTKKILKNTFRVLNPGGIVSLSYDTGVLGSVVDHDADQIAEAARSQGFFLESENLLRLGASRAKRDKKVGKIWQGFRKPYPDASL